jgi:nicotinamidase-related amidase
MNDNPSVLLLIDIQRGMDFVDYYGGERNNPYAEENAAKILRHWRTKAWPIYHIRHSSQLKDSPLHASHEGFAFKPETAPVAGEPIITKDVNSCFIGTDLFSQLKSKGYQSVIMVGLTTNHCISTSARMGANLGLDITVISDATAAFRQVGAYGEVFSADTVHRVSLANLNNEFAKVISTDELIDQVSS